MVALMNALPTRDEIAQLPPADRLTLIGELWDSLNDQDWSLPPAQAQELTRRLASFELDRAAAVPWTTLKSELRRTEG